MFNSSKSMQATATGGLGHKLDMSRRSFVKLAAVTGVATAMSAAFVPQALAEDHNSGSLPEAGVQRIRTMCRGCGKMECGVWVTVENGRAVKIEGDESSFASSGNSCSKSQASLQACYHPDRLAYPLKRTNPKGDDDPGWVRISWDEALQTAGNKFNEIEAQRGPNSVFSMCGTSRIYCMSSALGAQGILNTANTHQAYQICKGPRHVATGMVSARAYSWMATVDRPKVYVQWGGASELSNYDDSCRTTVDAATKADHHILVDPRMTNMGKEADIWNPLRPGTDGAVGLGWLNVIINNELYNDLWVKRWTNAPFLVCYDIEPSGWTQMGMGGGEEIKTRLLKESDLVEGGSPKKFIVFDQLNNRQTYFDAETSYWEGEQAWEITGKEAQQENLIPGMTQGFVPDMSGFNPEIDPQIWGTVDVVLKDGSGERFSRRQVLQRHRAKPRHPGRIGKTLRPEPGIHPARCGQQAQLCVHPARQEVAGLRAERFVNPLSPSMEGALWGAFFFWLRPRHFLRIFPPRCGQLDADVFAVALARLRELGEFLLENAFYPRSR